MVIKIINYSTNFIKKWQKLNQREKLRFKKIIVLFQENPFSPSLKTHKLKGKLKQYWSFALDYKHRVLFAFKKNNTALFYDFGGHEVYK